MSATHSRPSWMHRLATLTAWQSDRPGQNPNADPENGRPKVEVARGLGVDAKTVRRYVAPAEAAGMAPGGPPVAEEQSRALARQWFPQLAGTGIRQVSWREIAVHHDRIAGLLPVVPVS